ncbi:hypothetical protein FTO70_01405 [Methanosarcina sp. KYL-1]|uniref:hypothetical protein n=1 Tax=Methanosarcina sp. KYL-1 TaxID=2602068 RepID=UPI0021015470|nr:hypothetical protein [Methanosarcina sp. KYL-1]MCQ1534374.1 hypothetical protein [Methanosarcina sp. KYL-1]
MLGFEEEIGKIQAAIADFELGNTLNIALIAGPLGGKTTLLEEIERKNPGRVTKLGFPAVVRNKKEISLSPTSRRVVLLDDCHFLYMRKIGGFDAFYGFLDMISSRERLFISTWNLYSWNYLNEVFGLGKYFPVQVRIPALTQENLKTLILSGYGEGEIHFTEELESEKEPVVYLIKFPLPFALLGKKIDLLLPKINFPYLEKRFLKKEKEVSAGDRVFEKLYLESKGNPGVALRLWELGAGYPQARPEKIGGFSFEVELEYEEAFVLSLILSYQRLTRAEIAEMTGSDGEEKVNEAIFRLLHQKLIFIDGDAFCRVRPEALGSVVSYLEKLRLVW